MVASTLIFSQLILRKRSAKATAVNHLILYAGFSPLYASHRQELIAETGPRRARRVLQTDKAIAIGLAVPRSILYAVAPSAEWHVSLPRLDMACVGRTRGVLGEDWIKNSAV